MADSLKISGAAGDEDQLAPIAGEWIVERAAGALDARQAVEAIVLIAVERVEAIRRVIFRSRLQLDGDAASGLEAEILMLEIIQAAGEHSRSGDQRYRESRLHHEQGFSGERGAVTGASIGAAQRFDRIGARCEPGWRCTENHSG